MTGQPSGPTFGRRAVLKAGGAFGAAAATTTLPLVNVWGADSSTIRLGYIGARSGPLANFNAPDSWILDKVKTAIGSGIKNGGRSYALDIIVKDNQSDNDVSARVSNELVLRERCDFILANNGAAVLSVGPLADARGVPALSGMAPWEAFVIGRGKMPGPGYTGFPFSFHMGFSIGDMLASYIATWNELQTDKIVASLFQDDPAGRSMGNEHIGVPAAAAREGYKIVAGGYFQPTNNDFSNQVTKFKNGNADIVVAYSSSEQMVVIVNQMAQQKYQPKILTIAGAPLFPASIEALGDHGDGVTTEVWWTPAWPYRSPVTGQTAKEFAAAWESETGKQWTQPLGYTLGLWDAGISALRTAADPKNKVAIRDAVKNLDVETITGRIDFKSTHIPNVSPTPMCTGQWNLTKGGKFRYDLLVVTDKMAPSIPVQAKLKPYAG